LGKNLLKQAGLASSFPKMGSNFQKNVPWHGWHICFNVRSKMDCLGEILTEKSAK
jgi:hypothetical protein